MAMAGIGSEQLIPENELVFKFSRSGGPGGQHVNKVNTKVAVFFNVAASKNLSAEQKQRILDKLKGRSDKNGVIRVVSQRYRSQHANRNAAVERLDALLRWALKRKTVRRRTKMPRWSKKSRLEAKKRRSLVKQYRRVTSSDD